MNLYQYFMSFFTALLYPSSKPLDNPAKNHTPPNIIVIMTDDMGWNDVGFHGSNEIPTPNLDALAYNGVILSRHYVLPTCSPSRAAFLTGRHPIRMGLQGLPMNVAEPRAVPLSEKLLPEYLRELGYATRLVGKWHLGYYTPQHTPANRGFDSFVGYYGGYVTYFNHTVTKDKHTGTDFHADTPNKIEPLKDDKYLTDLITDHAEDIINSHDQRKPLYLHLAHVAGHAGEGAEQLETRNLTQVNNTFGYIPNLNRRKYAGIISAMDESVGRVVRALSDANMLNNSIIVFMSDNGAPSHTQANGPFENYGSNYPLRSTKAILFEGGIRVPAFVYSPLINSKSRVTEDYMHVTDWFPTLYKLAGGDLDKISNLDGMDQWSTISNAEKTKRDSIFLNIDEVFNRDAAIVGKYKLVRGMDTTYNGYYGINGENYSPKQYDTSEVQSSPAWEAIQKLPQQHLMEEGQITKLRKEAMIHCDGQPDAVCLGTCLYDIFEDPCEMTDISDKHPEIVDSIVAFIERHEPMLMNQTNTYIDPAGYPDNFNGFWMPWMDHEHTPPENRNKSAIWSTNVFCEGFTLDDPRNCL